MLFPEQGEDSGFDVIKAVFDASSEVRLRSSLSSIHDAVKAAPFGHDVHYRSHWTEAARGSLEPPPTRRLRRTFLHLSYSMTLSHLLDTVASSRPMVVERSAAGVGRCAAASISLSSARCMVYRGFRLLGIAAKCNRRIKPLMRRDYMRTDNYRKYNSARNLTAQPGRRSAPRLRSCKGRGP